MAYNYNPLPSNTRAAPSDIVNRYESLEALYAYCRSVPSFHRRSTSFTARGTLGAIDYCMRGATEQQQEPAKRLMAKIDASVQQRQRREYVAGPAGAFPVVPEYLQGLPMHMRRRVHVESDVAPIRLYVETLVSGGVTDDQLQRRGAALAALAMRLQETRPVELWACWAMIPRPGRRTVVGTAKIDLLPLSLAHACAVLGTSEFCRSITFCEAQARAGHNSSGIAWGWNGHPDTNQYGRNMRAALNMEPEDIYLPGGHLTEAEAYLRDPATWVNKYLDTQRTVE